MSNSYFWATFEIRGRRHENVVVCRHAESDEEFSLVLLPNQKWAMVATRELARSATKEDWLQESLEFYHTGVFNG